MEKINFVNNSEPYLSAENLNQMQDNIEEAIKETYSTEEKVIGTLLGKPLYQKLGSITFTKVHEGGVHTRGSLISADIEYSTISKVFGSKLGADSMYNSFDSSIKNNVYVENTSTSSDKGYIMGFAGTNTYVGTTVYVVVEYTKTTD